MATNANLKDALSVPARTDNLAFPDGITVGNASLVRLADAIKYRHPYNDGTPGGGEWPQDRPDANDAAAFLHEYARAYVLGAEKDKAVAEAAGAGPLVD